ncbi:MAG: TolC family protein [Bacteroidetes bacterium]|jgi:outer membrane protein|nr:TolC family protein [Bacteroidota bacterium]
MKKLLFSISVCLILCPGFIRAQEKIWSLEECIVYAIEHNIQIKQQIIQTDYQKNTLSLSKYKLLPTLNGQASHNYSFGRALDETTYEYTDNQNIQSNSFYAGGSVDIFKGFQNMNTIRRNKYQLQASEYDLENIKNNISMNIALGYLQILLNHELVNATASQLQITREQIEKTRKMYEAGSVAKGNLLQIEAQAASEELQLINLRNQLDISYLTLTQMLELDSASGFRISVPDIQIDTGIIFQDDIRDIFELAQGSRPEIKSAEMRLEASEYDLKIANGSRSPSLSMSHSATTRFSDIAFKMSDPTGNYKFSEQLNDNLNYGVGFSLNIPILNGWQINKNIANSRLSIENNRYALEAEKKQLYKNIQQAWADATAALKKYTASIKAVVSMEESFRYTEQKFDVGMVTPVDYNAAKTQLLQTQSDMTQAKYEFIFKTKLLDFYKGLPITLNAVKQ